MSKASRWAEQFGEMVLKATEMQPMFRDRNGNPIGKVMANGTLRLADRDEISPIVALTLARWILDTFEEDVPHAQ